MNDTGQQLAAAIEECIRLENELKAAHALIALLAASNEGSLTVTDEALSAADTYTELHADYDRAMRTTRFWVSYPAQVTPEPEPGSHAAVAAAMLREAGLPNVYAGEPQPPADAQKQEIDAEGADHAGNVESTPAGEGGHQERDEMCCEECGATVHTHGGRVFTYRDGPNDPRLTEDGHAVRCGVHSCGRANP